MLKQSYHSVPDVVSSYIRRRLHTHLLTLQHLLWTIRTHRIQEMLKHSYHSVPDVVSSHIRRWLHTHPHIMFHYTLHVAAPVVNCTVRTHRIQEILKHSYHFVRTHRIQEILKHSYHFAPNVISSYIAVGYIHICTLQLMLCTVRTHRVHECTLQDAPPAANMYTIVNKSSYTLLYPYSVLFIPSFPLIQLHVIYILNVCMSVPPPP
jgi:hypothetical protein